MLIANLEPFSTINSGRNAGGPGPREPGILSLSRHVRVVPCDLDLRSSTFELGINLNAHSNFTQPTGSTGKVISSDVFCAMESFFVQADCKD